MNAKKLLSELCTPASIYLVISLGSIIIALFYGFAISAVAMQVIFVFAWTFLLNFLCRKGMKMVSWLLVLFPYLITLGTWSMLTFKEGLTLYACKGPNSKVASMTYSSYAATNPLCKKAGTAPAPRKISNEQNVDRDDVKGNTNESSGGGIEVASQKPKFGPR
jgi:hypothetical protein